MKGVKIHLFHTVLAFYERRTMDTAKNKKKGKNNIKKLILAAVSIVLIAWGIVYACGNNKDEYARKI